jgi:hypothetical protein
MSKAPIKQISPISVAQARSAITSALSPLGPTLQVLALIAEFQPKPPPFEGHEHLAELVP